MPPNCDAAPGEAWPRFQAIFEASPDCIKLVSAEGKLIDMNAAGLRMIEADCVSQIRGRSLFDLIDPAHHGSFRQTLNAVFAGKVAQTQFEVIGLKGRRLFMDQSAAPLFAHENPQRVLEMVAVTRDVSPQRRAEAELLQARLAQDIARSAAALAAQLGRDLNSPLDNIIGYSEMLLEAAQEHHRARDAEDQRRVLDAAEELRARLNRLLQTALAEVRQDQALSVGDLDDLIDAAVKAIRPLADANRNQISVEISSQCSSLPHDEDKFAQSLQAMLSHAVTHTSDGVITVKARQVLTSDQSWLVLSVADTGPCMAPEELDALLNPPAGPLRPDGNALSGLAAARKLALFLGGDISAASAPGRGTRLTLKAPLSRSAASMGAASPASRAAP